MSRPLAESVYVAGRFYAAGDVPDEEYAALITNPRAWGDPVEADRPSRRAPAARDSAAAPIVPPADPPAVTDPVFDPVFDPSADGVSVDDVNNHLANADESEVARVLTAEAAGKKRKGILEGPYAPDEA